MGCYKFYFSQKEKKKNIYCSLFRITVAIIVFSIKIDFGAVI